MLDLSGNREDMSQLADAFDKDTRIIEVYEDSKLTFENWAAIGENELPADAIDAMQVKLMRWQRKYYGDQSDERMALGMVKEVAECEMAQTLDDAEDALGDASVYASQLCTNNRLAIGPILQLVAQLDTLDPGVAGHIVSAQGALAQVVLKATQKIRGMDDAKKYRIRLVGAIAHVLSRCGLIVAALKFDGPGDDIEVDFGKTLLIVGGEVVKRGEGHEAIPKLVVH